MDPHILNLYECNDLLIADLFSIIERALSGNLDATEKLDGQNFSFTVIDGHVRYLGKGLPKWAVEQGGLDAVELRTKLKNSYPNTQLAETFSDCQNALDIAINNTSTWRLFQHGNVAVIGELLAYPTANVIRYKDRHVIFHSCAATTKGVDVDTSTPTFSSFCERVARYSRESWKFRGPVKLNMTSDSFKDTKASLYKQLEGLLKYRAKTSETVEQLVTSLVFESLDPIAPRWAHNVSGMAHRLAFKDTKSFSSKTHAASWKWFKEIEKERTLYYGQALIPFERFCQDLGAAVIERAQGTLNDELYSKNEAQRIQAHVREIRKAYFENRIYTDSHTLELINLAIQRVGDETRFTHAVEGIVFEWEGKMLKLSGLFPAINRLFSYFQFGENPARIK